MSKHTKGKWEISLQENNYDSRPHVYTSDGQTFVAIVDGWNEEEAEANAKLIAAAPELLQALKNLVLWQAGSINHYQALKDAEAAINKAIY